MVSRSKYDGAIFTPAPLAKDDPSSIPEDHGSGIFTPEPGKMDSQAWVSAITTEVNAWKVKSSRNTASKSAIRTADALLMQCRAVQAAADNNGKAQSNGLTVKLTSAALIELGYLLCQFRVQAAGFEKFAAIGLKQHPHSWRTGDAPTQQARDLRAANKGARVIATACNVSKSVAERWCKTIDEENS